MTSKCSKVVLLPRDVFALVSRAVGRLGGADVGLAVTVTVGVLLGVADAATVVASAGVDAAVGGLEHDARLIMRSRAVATTATLLFIFVPWLLVA